MRFYTYRDPRIDESIERMAAAGRAIASFSPDEAEMEGFVVSCVAGIDAPLKARDRVRRQDGMYFGGYTCEQRAMIRNQVIEARSEERSCSRLDGRARRGVRVACASSAVRDSSIRCAKTFT